MTQDGQPEMSSETADNLSAPDASSLPNVCDASGTNQEEATLPGDAPKSNGSTPSQTNNRGDAVARSIKLQPGSSPTAMQDMFLNGLRRENIDVVIYLSDGAQERGVVRGFDTFTILLENRNSGKSQLIYKHAVIRIFPTRNPTMQPGGERVKK